MSSGACPTSANMDMFGASTGNSIEANMIGSTNTSNFTNFDSMRTACITNMINDSYGTRNVTPTQTHHFRGYPKPAITMSYEEPIVGSTQYLTCQPSFSNKIGFNYTITLSIDEYRSDTNGLLGSHTETVTINAGGTTASSSSMSTYGGDYKVNDYNPNSTYDVDIDINHTYTSSGYAEDFTVSDSFTLQYQGVTSYAHYCEPISSLSCSAAPDGFSGSTYYANTATLSNGVTLYTTSALTTTIPNDDYAFNVEDDTYFDYGSTSSGVISGFTNCP